MKEVKLQVKGMSCQHCVNAVEGALQEVGASGHVDLQNQSVTVQYDEKIVTLEAVTEAIEEQGYEVVKQ